MSDADAQARDTTGMHSAAESGSLKPVAEDERRVRWELFGIAALVALITLGIVSWIIYASTVNHWLAVHTGTVNESGPYYGFWSGFGSDIAEFGVLGAIGAAIYQVFRKYNCHEPGCWRVGSHPAAGGQFLLCYHHHPDFAGKKPTHDLIVRMHQQHVEQQAAIHEKLVDIHHHLAGRPTDTPTPQAERSPTEA
jgi:hypothetical protein